MSRDQRSRVVFWVGWHLVACLVLVSINVLGASTPPWEFGRAQLFVVGTLVAGYGAGAVIVHLNIWRKKRSGAADVIVAGAAGYSPALLALIVTGVDLSVTVVMITVTAGFLLLGTVFLIGSLRKILTAALAIGLALVWTLAVGANLSPLAPDWGGERQTRQISTSLYSLEATYHRDRIPKSYSGVAGGGIALLQRELLVVTGDGDLYSLGWEASSGDEPFEVRPVGRVPLNRDAFRETTGQAGYLHWFRVLDLYAQRLDHRVRIFVSHHRWRSSERCFVVRVSMLETESLASLQELTADDWTMVHETEPCLPLKEETSPSWPFRGMEGGGRMETLGDEQLLLTVGDQGFNGYRFEPNYVQDANASYGKVVRIDLNDGSWQPYSIGHRNPQGLLVEEDGDIWLTEHGPRGGDELNRIRDGANYGWPRVTLGTDYGKHVWPLSERQGEHGGFERPVFAWTPTIGVSNIIGLQSGLFDSWEGDLLVGSLVGKTLYRLKAVDDQVSMVEPINIGERIRDLVEDDRGRIILWTDSYSIVVVEPTSMVFAHCSGCHTVSDGTNHGLGPDLAGIPGRGIASAEGFQFSTALEKLEGRWTAERLDRFLENPQAVAPGTSMRMEGIDDPEIRATIIEYLRSQSQGRGE